MANVFTINNKKYVAKPFTFNLMCDFEDMGIKVETMFTKPMKLNRSYLALCGDISEDEAGIEIQAHIIGGNDLTQLAEVIEKEIESSDFFRSLFGRAEDEDAPEAETTTPEKTESSASKRQKKTTTV